MKLNKKLILVSAAILLASPALGTVNKPINFVAQAANKKSNTITVNKYTGLFNSHGKMLTSYQGKPFDTFNKTTTLKYHGNPVKIKGNYYYYIGHGAYAATTYLMRRNGREVLTLNYNSHVYTRKGKRTRKILNKHLNYYFTGTYKKNDQANNNVFNRNGHTYQLKTTRIKGSDYFRLNKDQYIKVANISSIGADLVTQNEITITIKKNTNAIMPSNQMSVIVTDRNLKKGQKITADALVGINDGGNSTPYAYRIKGTKTYVWRRDAYSRHNLTLVMFNPSDETNYVVRPPKDGLQFYNISGENVTPKGFTYPEHQLLGVDGMMYLWLPSQNKAVLCYHTVATEKDFDSPKINGHWRDSIQKIGNAFVPVADTEYWSGLASIKPKVINTAVQAEADAHQQASDSQLSELRTALNQANSAKNTSAYKLSTYSTRKNYDVTIQETQNLLNSKRNPSSAEIQLMTWILQTRTKNLHGKKIQVDNINKLSRFEIEQLESLLLGAERGRDDQNHTFTSLTYDKSSNKVYQTTTNELQDNKVISKVEEPLTDFVTQK